MEHYQSRNYKKYTNKNAIKTALLNNFLKSVYQLIAIANAKKILDVGCGEGFVIQHIRKHNKDAEINGIDLSKGALAMAKSKIKDCKFIYGDASGLPFKDNHFDVVLALEVLEHLKDPKKALGEIRRVTKKYAVISVPNEPYFSISNLFRCKNIGMLGKDPEHRWFWNENNIKALIGQYFNIVTIKKPFPWVAILAQKKDI